MSRPPRHLLLQAYTILVCFTICVILLLSAYSERWTGQHTVVASLTNSRLPKTSVSIDVQNHLLATSANTLVNVAAMQLEVANAAQGSLNQTTVAVTSPVDMQSILQSLAKANYHRLAYQFTGGATLECGDTPFLAVVVVQCLPRHSLRRATIRQTWGTEARSAGFKVIFFLGRECADDPTDVERVAGAKVDEALSGEASEYGDLLIADFCEHYLNLTLKTLLMIKWAAAHCTAASYLVKIDSDVYLHAGRLRQLLLQPTTKPALVTSSIAGGDGGVEIITRRREIIGKLADRHAPSRSLRSKWYMPYDLFDGRFYPPFVYGPCYALSTDLLVDLAAACNRRPYLPYEDVFVTGMCAEELVAVTRRGSTTFIEKRCGSNVAVAVHWYSCWKNRPVELRVLFANETAS